MLIQKTRALLRPALFTGGALITVAIFSPDAFAGEFYLGASGSINFQRDSNNQGQTGAFTTGNGAPALPFGSPIAVGTNYGWDTEFDTGWGASFEGGYVMDSGFRPALEIVFSRANVGSHANVAVGGTNIDAVDAAVLTGSATQLGANVGTVVADGQGRIRNFGAFANLYYDFPVESFPFQPYIGAGIGLIT